MSKSAGETILNAKRGLKALGHGSDRFQIFLHFQTFSQKIFRGQFHSAGVPPNQFIHLSKQDCAAFDSKIGNSIPNIGKNALGVKRPFSELSESSGVFSEQLSEFEIPFSE